MEDQAALKAIETKYAEIDEAFRSKDLDTVARHIAPNWVGTAGGKTVTRDQLMENVWHQFETLDNISWHREIELVGAEGELVTVRAVGVFRATKRESGEPLELNLANDDTWTNGPGGWQVTRSVGVE